MELKEDLTIPFLFTKNKPKWYHYVFFFQFILAPLVLILRVAMLIPVLIFFFILFVSPFFFVKDVKKHPCLLAYAKGLTKLLTFVFLCIFNIWFVTKNRPKKKDRQNIYVCNHTCNWDIILLFFLDNCSFLSKIENSKTFLLGSLCDVLECMFVDRKSNIHDFEHQMMDRYKCDMLQEMATPTNQLIISRSIETVTSDNKNTSIVDAKVRQRNTHFKYPTCVFSEGTFNNRQYLIKFKNGAFRFKQNVQPVVFKYYSYFDMSGIFSEFSHLLRLCMNMITIIKIEYLEVIPYTNFHNAQDFTDYTYTQMCKALNVKQSVYTLDDFVYFYYGKQLECKLSKTHAWMKSYKHYRKMCLKNCKNTKVQYEQHELMKM